MTATIQVSTATRHFAMPVNLQCFCSNSKGGCILYEQALLWQHCLHHGHVCGSAPCYCQQDGSTIRISVQVHLDPIGINLPFDTDQLQPGFDLQRNSMTLHMANTVLLKQIVHRYRVCI